MPRIVVVPATPLLVRGASGAVDPLGPVREAVQTVLRRELDDASDVVVIGAGHHERAGRLRPTLGSAGITDAQLTPAPPGPVTAPWDGDAAAGPSVALLALVEAGVDVVAQAVDVVEVPGDAAGAVVASVAQRLGALPPTAMVLVADQPSPGVDAVLERLAAAGAWDEEVLDLPQEHEHLPASYRIVVRRPLAR